MRTHAATSRAEDRKRTSRDGAEATSGSRPEVVHQVDGWRTVGGRFPDLASLRSGKRPLRARWVDVFRTSCTK